MHSIFHYVDSTKLYLVQALKCSSVKAEPKIFLLNLFTFLSILFCQFVLIIAI